MTDNLKEMLPLVDEAGNITGAATRGECHGGSRLLHPVVHLHVFNSQGDIFLQKRPEWKDIQPGKWDTAVGGHVDLGENMDQALIRKVKEELNLEVRGFADSLEEARDGQAYRLMSYLYDSVRERELVFVNIMIYDGDITPSEETDGGRFWTRQEIHDAIGQNILTPNLEMEYQRILPMLQ